VSVTLLGEVERVTFENEETSFRVLRLHRVEGMGAAKRVTVVGTVPAVGPGTRVRVSGRFETDSRHGERLRVESLVVIVPETVQGLEKYLGSGVIAGLGPGFAKRIVNYFGLESLRMLDVEPHRLAEVPGLGKAKVEEIRKGWIEHRGLSNVLLALGAYDTTPGLAQRIVKHFGERAQAIVQESPYRLAIEVYGVGFKTADRIAHARGIASDHPERAQAGVLHELRAWADNGHCLSPRSLLVERAQALLEIAPAHVESAIDALAERNWLVLEGDLVFLERLARAEERVTEHVARLLVAPSHQLPQLESLLRDFEAQHGVRLAPAQERAVLAAAVQKFVVITGGPGVGKTTIVQAILFVLEKQRLRVALAAPTGRAAKRLNESTGRRATTLHRLLEVEGRTGKFQRNSEHPLEVDLLIVDEASMIDVALMADLLEATPSAARVVLVGDADQLPSVGPGWVLGDLIQSGVVPVSRLDVVFRQSRQSGIVENAHRILVGETPVGASDPDGDFFVISCAQPEKARDLVCQLVRERIPSRFGLDAVRDVQVLTPMHRGHTGTLQLNEKLQNLLNPTGLSLRVGDMTLRARDKVMQRKNDYDKAVFNGDVGEVQSVDPGAGRVVVSYESDEGLRQVAYERGELGQLGLAYATTIHKSQGSEYPAVVIVLLAPHFVMLSRNLLYTAVTRAKRLCVLVVDPRALTLALSETRKEERQTFLAQRLERMLEHAGPRNFEPPQ